MNPDIVSKIKDRLLIFICNFSDDSICLLEWAKQNQLPKNNIKVVTIDTGFGSESFWTSVKVGQAYAQSLGFEIITLSSKIKFDEAVLGRNEFPTKKFQWCSALLKGLPLLDWLDEIDRSCRSIIVIGKRRETVKTNKPSLDNSNSDKTSKSEQLIEWVDFSSHFNDRSVWYPILDLDTATKNKLIQTTGIKPSFYPSQECFPCVNSSLRSLSNMNNNEINKIKILESATNKTMFIMENFKIQLENFNNYGDNNQIDNNHVYNSHVNNVKNNNSIEKIVHQSIKIQKKIKIKNETEINKNILAEFNLYYQGCGNHFGCGI